MLLLERRDSIPPPRQKVGESSVQVAGYYLSKVLDLEEYLLRNHYMKYNLRFYWKSAGRDNSRFEEFGKAFIRPFSNIASYQLNRNRLEADLLEMCKADSRFTYQSSVRNEDASRPSLLHKLGAAFWFHENLTATGLLILSLDTRTVSPSMTAFALKNLLFSSAISNHDRSFPSRDARPAPTWSKVIRIACPSADIDL